MKTKGLYSWKLLSQLNARIFQSCLHVLRKTGVGAQAALRALEMAGLSPADLDLIITGTTTPDMFFPCTSCFIQAPIIFINSSSA